MSRSGRDSCRESSVVARGYEQTDIANLQDYELDWVVPDFSTLSRRQRTLAVNIPYRGSKGPLHLLIDSNGIEVEGEGEWDARKHGGPKRRVWRKFHIGIDEHTLEVRAVEITGSNTGDAPMLPHLLNQIPRGQEIGSVTADGAYDTRRCHNAIADRGAAAVIPPRKNAQPWKPCTAGAVGGTTRSAHRSTWVWHSGGTGADTTAEVASRKRCIA